MHLTTALAPATTAKPIINLAQLQQVKGAYLRFRSLGFTRPAIESHLCGMVLLDEELIEEVEAVLVATAQEPSITPSLAIR
ncbi:hypothetical protein DNI29_19010 [Hymenobacter sediminis]|uniref:hypothetical protein n=1 Tax=Hymenobacter sediminis TaxID=2218621 RepID=UPI000DA6C08C|nr:hypothetical protein [Hymenobacter sediminis]RPD45472.1 hypothetical protein DNI29_19010 [Hymenobacter sediminis]